MFKGFKEFISKGNVIDVAVGFVAGAAFTALVTGITGATITPMIGLIAGKIETRMTKRQPLQ